MTGYGLARKKISAMHRLLLPAGFHLGRRAGDGCADRPNLLVLAELELWPNLIRLSHAAGVKVAIVNGRLSERSAFAAIDSAGGGCCAAAQMHRPHRRAERRICRAIPGAGARAESVHVTGSLKFDGAQTDRR